MPRFAVDPIDCRFVEKSKRLRRRKGLAPDVEIETSDTKRAKRETDCEFRDSVAEKKIVQADLVALSRFSSELLADWSVITWESRCC